MYSSCGLRARDDFLPRVAGHGSALLIRSYGLRIGVGGLGLGFCGRGVASRAMAARC